VKQVKSSDFWEQVLERQGPQCIIPACGAPWTDVAHIQGSGMGGRPSTYRAENLVGLCHPCHDAFDGNRAWLMRTLMEAWARRVWWDRALRCGPEEPVNPVAEAHAEIERRYGPKGGT